MELSPPSFPCAAYLAAQGSSNTTPLHVEVQLGMQVIDLEVKGADVQIKLNGVQVK